MRLLRAMYVLKRETSE